MKYLLNGKSPGILRPWKWGGFGREGVERYPQGPDDNKRNRSLELTVSRNELGRGPCNIPLLKPVQSPTNPNPDEFSLKQIRPFLITYYLLRSTYPISEMKTKINGTFLYVPNVEQEVN